MSDRFMSVYMRSFVCRMAGVVMILLLLAVSSCRHTPYEVTGRMDVVDSIMEERPDSALTILESVDTAQLHGRADRARYALLKSMAIDKNLIDTATFSILQPAIDYYLKHGTPDQRLKTRYYEGRIHMNRGDDAAALTSFLKAVEDSAECTEPRALALLYTYIGVMYFRQYNVASFIRANTKAAALYLAAHDTATYLRSKIKILYMATSISDTVSSRRASADISRFSDHINSTGMDISGGWLWYYKTFGVREQIDSVIDSYRTAYNSEFTVYSRLDLSEILDEIGEYEESLKQLEIINKEMCEVQFTQDDSIKYLAIASGIYEHNGRLQEALNAYKQYIDLTEEHYTYLFNSGFLFTKEKHEIELANGRKESGYILSIVISSILLLVCIISIIIISCFIFILRRNRQKMKTSREQLELQYQNLILDNRSIQMEKDLIYIEMEKSKQERENLDLVSKMLSRQVRELEEEKIKLTELLASSKMSAVRNEIIRSRIDILDDYIRRCITGNVRYGKELQKIERDIREHKQNFLTYIKDLYLKDYPEIASICKEASLSEKETNYICLLAFGLSSKEIGTYLEINRVNHFAGEIRAKLNIPKNESTLSTYIKSVIGKVSGH